MNAYERSLNRIHNRPVDRVPNWDIFMGFGVHHIGESLDRYYQDYRVLVSANLAVIEDFEIDIAQAISDPYREAADFGLDVAFPTDGLPLRVRPLIREPADLKKIKPPDPEAGRRMSDRLRGIQALKETLGGSVPVMGWVEGALAEANDLRGDAELMLDLVDRPEWARELLEMCCEVAITFARAQIRAGADIIGLGDAIASLVSPAMYREFALPYEKRIFDAVHEAGALARLHICGNTTRLLADMVTTGADIIDIDWMVDIRQAAHVFGRGPALCGNFDPVRVMFSGTPRDVEQAVLDCLENGGPKVFSCAGCEIPDGTTIENLHAQRRALREYGAAGG